VDLGDVRRSRLKLRSTHQRGRVCLRSRSAIDAGTQPASAVRPLPRWTRPSLRHVQMYVLCAPPCAPNTPLIKLWGARQRIGGVTHGHSLVPGSQPWPRARRPARRRDRPYRMPLARHRRSGTGQNRGQIQIAAVGFAFHSRRRGWRPSRDLDGPLNLLIARIPNATFGNSSLAGQSYAALANAVNSLAHIGNARDTSRRAPGRSLVGRTEQAELERRRNLT
jgi:hypothetical protein